MKRCVECGSEFVASKNRKTCSEKCSAANARKNQKAARQRYRQELREIKAKRDQH
jgi:hypothetical protein